MCKSHIGTAAWREAGFTYIGLLITIVILGLLLSAVGTVWRTQAQREREQELLFIGRQFKTAIARYYGANAGGGRRYPQEIAELLEDKRFPEPKHYLRELYNDPMTGAADWTILRTPSIGITGIASSSKGVPLKRTGFPNDESRFQDADCYCDWQFEYIPRNIRRRASPAPAASD